MCLLLLLVVGWMEAPGKSNEKENPRTLSGVRGLPPALSTPLVLFFHTLVASLFCTVLNYSTDRTVATSDDDDDDDGGDGWLTGFRKPPRRHTAAAAAHIHTVTAHLQQGGSRRLSPIPPFAPPKTARGDPSVVAMTTKTKTATAECLL